MMRTINTNKYLSTVAFFGMMSVSCIALSEVSHECQFDAPVTMTFAYGDVPAGETLNMSLEFDVDLVPIGSDAGPGGAAAYATSSGMATLSHDTYGELSADITAIQITNTGTGPDLSENAFDTLQVWYSNVWQGTLGGEVPPAISATSNGYVTGYFALSFTDNTGPALTDLEFPQEVETWNAFQTSGTRERSLRITRFNSAGVVRNNHVADIGDFSGGCVPIEENYTCFGQEPTIIGTDGHDYIIGTSGPDVIVSLGGHDVIESLGGDDLVCSGIGHDYVNLGAGNDRAKLGPGNDTGHAGTGSDRINAGAGNDTVRLGNGDDFVNGKKGIDVCFGGKGSDVSKNCDVNTLIETVRP